MYSEELNAKLRSDRNWFRDNTELVSVENISISDMEGQVRKGGICASHVQKLMEDIKMRGQLVPITIDDEDFSVIEGNHRFEAFNQLSQKKPGGDWDKIRVHRRTFNSPEERQKYQLQANDAPPRKGSTDEDYVDLIVKNLQDGVYGDITWDSYYDDSANYDLLVASVKNKFSGLSVNANTVKRFVRTAVQSAPGSKFRNHMMSDLVKAAGCSKDTKWNGVKAKEESNGWWLTTCGQSGHIFPQLAGNSLNRKINNSNINNSVVFNCSNLEGMSAAKLDKWRRDRVVDVNKINNANKILKAKLIDEILFSPHKIEDGCVENGFFKVKKKSNRVGDFDPDSIPTSGW